MNLREVQTRLAAMRLYDGRTDGVHGPLTRAAIDALFLARGVHGRGWSIARRLVAAGQLFAAADGIEVGRIDGLPGPQTRHAFEVYDARKRGVEGLDTWRDAENGLPAPPAPAGNAWPRQGHADMVRCFGPVGANQTEVAVPDAYPLRLAWDPAKAVRKFSCHEKLRAPVARVLVRVLDHYGPERIAALGLDLFGGCLNVRRMRGGSAWSTHAWGAALDFDPEHNQLRWSRTRARFARPDYAKWWSLWEAEGFVSLGRVRDFDWMHVQAARL